MIRPATQVDIAAIVDLSIEALSIDAYDELVISRERVYAGVKECVCSAANFSWVSEKDGKILGGLGAFVVPMAAYERSICMVNMWYCKNPGDGRRLLRQFMAWVKTRPMIKQVIYTGERNADPRVGKMVMAAGFGEILPTYVLTR